MVNELINNRSLVEQKVDAYTERLRPFYPNDEHLWMACLASFPVSVNIHMLYQIWSNFNSLQDKEGAMYRIPVLTVSDTILSPLFVATGTDLYEMDGNIRAYLLEKLEEKFGDGLLKALASFLFKYAREFKAENIWKNFYESQEWTAILAVDPSKAAENILGSLKDHIDNNNSFQSIGVANLLATLVKDNKDFASLIKNSLETVSPDRVPAQPEAKKSGGKKNIVISSNNDNKNKIKVNLPRGVSSQLMGLYKSTGLGSSPGPSPAKPQTYAILVAGSRYGNQPLSSVEMGAKALNDILVRKQIIAPENVRMLTGAVTVADVIDSLQKFLSGATSNARLIFYYHGEGFDENPSNPGLILSDSAGQNIVSENLTAREFYKMIRSATNDVSVTTILDSGSILPSDWLMEAGPHDSLLWGNSNDQLVSEGTTPFLEMLIGGWESVDEITNRELYRYILSVNPPGHFLFFAGHDEWDNYFLGDGKESVVLQIQKLLASHGYGVTVDGIDGPQTKEACRQFNEKYDVSGVTTNESQKRALERAALLQDKEKITVTCFLNRISNDFFYVQKIPETLKRRRAEVSVVNLGGWIFPTSEDIHNNRGNAVFNSIISSFDETDLFFVGLNRQVVDNVKACIELQCLADAASALNKEVVFVIEEECNWRKAPFVIYSPPIIVYEMLPSNFKPVDTAEGLDQLLDTGELDSIIYHLEKFLKPLLSQPQGPSIEEKIAEAEKSNVLDLSKSDISEFPAEIRRLKGLRELDISDNKLMALSDWIAELTNLEILKINGNKMIRYLPEEMGTLRHLRVFNASNTLIYSLPSSFDQLINLRELYLADARLAVIDPVLFRSLKLHSIDLGNGVINIPPGMAQNAQSLQDYVSGLVTDEDHFLSVIEIHSENARPHYDLAPEELRDRVAYHFFDQVEKPHDVFRLILQHRGKEHTIVYLCDEKNILLPQFGDNDILQQTIYFYFRAFHLNFNLIANNPLIGRSAISDLTGPGVLNFAAIRSNTVITGKSFPDLFFEKLYEKYLDRQPRAFISTTGDLLRQIPEISNVLRKAGFMTFSIADYEAAAFDVNFSEKIRHEIRASDIFVLIVSDGYRQDYSRSFQEKTLIEQDYEFARAAGKPVLGFISSALNSGDRGGFIEHLLKTHILNLFKSKDELLMQLLTSGVRFLDTLSQSRRSLKKVLEEISQIDKPRDGNTGYDLLFNPQQMVDFEIIPVEATQRKESINELPGNPFCIDVLEDKVAWLHRDGRLIILSAKKKLLERKTLKAGPANDQVIGLNLRMNCAYVQKVEGLVSYNLDNFSSKTIDTRFPVYRVETDSNSEVVVLGDGKALLNIDESGIVTSAMITRSSRAQSLWALGFSVITNGGAFILYHDSEKAMEVQAFKKAIHVIRFTTGGEIYVAGIDDDYVVIKSYNVDDPRPHKVIQTELHSISDMIVFRDDIMVATPIGVYRFFDGKTRMVSDLEDILCLAFEPPDGYIVLAGTERIYLYTPNIELVWTFDISTNKFEADAPSRNPIQKAPTSKKPQTPKKPVAAKKPATSKEKTAPKKQSTPKKPASPKKAETPKKPASPKKPPAPKKPSAPKKPPAPKKPSPPKKSTPKRKPPPRKR